ncbi:MAG: DUF5610 domain-containing protein [Candidatus Riflebacteria bacterium]|nr:DUF5610 domain-containing protein [Candidatus Riflebacteria bacterium]
MVDKIQLGSALQTGSDKGLKNRKAAGANEQSKSAGGLNVDKFGLSDDARNKVVWARAQFEVNYQVLKSVNSAQGYETTRETFSFKASQEFIQKASGEVAAADEAIPSGEDNVATGNVEETPEHNQLTMLQEYFSPENTARRILDVATSFFGISEIARADGNTEAARRNFADFIGDAINTGFQQARSLLGELPEEVVSGIDKTHSLVFSGLEDFVSNGISAEKSASGGVFEKIAAYRQEAAAMQATLKTDSSSKIGYNSSGEVLTGQPENQKIVTRG